MTAMGSVPACITRLIVAGIVGVVMCAMCVVAAWTAVARHGTKPIVDTRNQLMDWRNFIEEYRYKNERLPHSLDETLAGTGKNPETLLDFWGRPYRYEHTQSEFKVGSLGRDGQQGGVGLDADLWSDHLRPKESTLPLLQFLTTVHTQSLWAYAVMSGILAGGLAYREIGRRNNAVHGLLKSSLQIFLFGVLAAWMASMHAAAEYIPNGH